MGMRTENTIPRVQFERGTLHIPSHLAHRFDLGNSELTIHVFQADPSLCMAHFRFDCMHSGQAVGWTQEQRRNGGFVSGQKRRQATFSRDNRILCMRRCMEMSYRKIGTETDLHHTTIMRICKREEQRELEARQHVCGIENDAKPYPFDDISEVVREHKPLPTLPRTRQQPVHSVPYKVTTKQLIPYAITIKNPVEWLHRHRPLTHWEFKLLMLKQGRARIERARSRQ